MNTIMNAIEYQKSTIRSLVNNYAFNSFSLIAAYAVDAEVEQANAVINNEVVQTLIDEDFALYHSVFCTLSNYFFYSILHASHKISICNNKAYVTETLIKHANVVDFYAYLKNETNLDLTDAMHAMHNMFDLYLKMILKTVAIDA